MMLSNGVKSGFSFVLFVGWLDWSNKYMLLASKRFATEKLRRKVLNLRPKHLT